MSFKATVIADSLNTINPSRLVIFEVTFPRFILAEVNTHRAPSRNSASSRAIPIARQLELIEEHPFIPEAFSLNKAGMSADEYVRPGDPDYNKLVDIWLSAKDNAVRSTRVLSNYGIHKQHANRLIEPFMWHTAIISGTEWDNFWDLRISPHAQPEINKLATLMKEAYDASAPDTLSIGEWHLPYVDDDEKETQTLTQCIISSSARTAAASYNRQHLKDYPKEYVRYSGLVENKHMSPLEHPATPTNNIDDQANFKGFKQARRFIEKGQSYT